MESLHPETPVANIDDGGGESVATAAERLAKAGAALAGRAAEAGLAADVAALYRDDPLRAEAAFRDMVFGMARSVLADAFETPGDRGDSVEAGGRTCRRAGHRPSGTGASLVPAEAVLGLTPCGTAPAAAGLSMHLTGGLTARGSGDAWRRLCGSGPSTASLVRLSGEAGSRMEERSGEIMPDLREREDMPEGAVSLPVPPGGVMMRMNAGTADGKPTDAGWRGASCGVVALAGADGSMPGADASGASRSGEGRA